MFELSRALEQARISAGEAMAKWLRWMTAALAFTAPVSAADSFADLQAAYHCDVVRRLEQVYATGDPRIDLNRYLAITLPARTHAYVQCQIFDNRRRIHCEASSGFWLAKKGQKRTFYLPPRTVAALARLGFDTDDSAGNFNLERDVDKSANFHPLADLMLRALHDGYDARSDMKLQFNAPFAPATPESCIPVS
ncbi:hypothetical protein [Tardiphaga sp.]|uniref:TY-Chap domain-containing protein n=1 Tax=Tardiphaga sp. TaxID=1926292 RepID=UPI0019B2A50C|nr:hypothetical protein [Tardiphaga sp.]MBC7579493.1 hypothetical protein [Tardiphaga sp.]